MCEIAKNTILLNSILRKSAQNMAYTFNLTLHYTLKSPQSQHLYVFNLPIYRFYAVFL